MSTPQKNLSKPVASCDKKPVNLSWKIEISSEKLVKKTCEFHTKIVAETLEEAHKIATEKAKVLQETDPAHSLYFVTEVQLVK